MNSETPAIWPQNLREENMVPPAASEEDFANYLDLDLDFSSFDNVNVHGEHGPIDTEMAGYSMDLAQQQQQEGGNSMIGDGNHTPFTAQGQHSQSQPPQPQPSQQQQQPQPQQQMAQQIPQMYQSQLQYHRQRTVVPPTPTSNEIHGGVAQFYQSTSGQLMYDQFRSKDDQVSLVNRLVKLWLMSG